MRWTTSDYWLNRTPVKPTCCRYLSVRKSLLPRQDLLIVQTQARRCCFFKTRTHLHQVDLQFDLQLLEYLPQGLLVLKRSRLTLTDI
jgi:hypothetical protein